MLQCCLLYILDSVRLWNRNLWLPISNPSFQIGSKVWRVLNIREYYCLTRTSVCALMWETVSRLDLTKAALDRRFFEMKSRITANILYCVIGEEVWSHKRLGLNVGSYQKFGLIPCSKIFEFQSFPVFLLKASFFLNEWFILWFLKSWDYSFSKALTDQRYKLRFYLDKLLM